MRTPHYLTPLKSDTLPRLHVAFDTETKLTQRAGRAEHRWACGAHSAIQQNDAGEWHRWGPFPSDTPEQLWTAIVGESSANGSVVAWAHNLGFDLRISEALRWLPYLGYELEAIVLERTSAWAKFTSKTGTVTICDLYSWLPVSLGGIAAGLDESRKHMDYSQADEGDLRYRCVTDVRTTARAVQHILEFLSEAPAGPFRPTGSGQSHAYLRRNYLKPGQVLIHNDTHALERERTAMWAGRCEVWRHGSIAGPVNEWDFNLAYCRIANQHEVPVRLLHKGGGYKNIAGWICPKGRATLADVTVTTDIPLVPAACDDRILWPVGTFDTTLWDPEVNLLLKHGAKVTINRHWEYQTAPALKPVTDWLLESLDPDYGPHSRIVRIMLKHWARTIVGRCALRYRSWEDFGTCQQVGLSLSTQYDLETAETTELLHVGNRIMELAGMLEADTSVPQITGWVMSQARVNLWELMCSIGLENVLYVDTDSVITNTGGIYPLEHAPRVPAGTHLGHKGTYASATIHGPRNIELEHKRLIAGVPTRAIRIGNLEFDGEVWASVKSSLSGRQLDNVAVTRRVFRVKRDDYRRKHNRDGTTQPYILGGTND